jgi:hypothetical protein
VTGRKCRVARRVALFIDSGEVVVLPDAVQDAIFLFDRSRAFTEVEFELEEAENVEIKA